MNCKPFCILCKHHTKLLNQHNRNIYSYNYVQKQKYDYHYVKHHTSKLRVYTLSILKHN